MAHDISGQSSEPYPWVPHCAMKLTRALRGLRFSGVVGLMVQKPKTSSDKTFFFFLFFFSFKVFVRRRGCTSSARHFISAAVITFLLSQKSPGHLQRQVPTPIMRKLRGGGLSASFVQLPPAPLPPLCPQPHPSGFGSEEVAFVGGWSSSS